jgi:small subunit ribosomal protein S2
MKQLLEAGVHFGHQTRRWNPKMKRFIFGERNGIYIIDLQQTLERIEKAYHFTRDLASEGGTIMFIGTKKQAQEPIADGAGRSGMPFVNQRWLGGMLTNFTTIHGRVSKMNDLERQVNSPDFAAVPKKEALLLRRELDKLKRNLGGIRFMEKQPDAVFIIDTKKEHIAVTEANKLGIPVVAVVDTNCDPDLIDYVIPGNDDAIRASALMCRVIADAVEEGRYMASRKGRVLPKPQVAAPPPPVDPEAERQRAERQARARAEAAAAQRLREERLAAAKQAAAEAAAAAPAPAEPTAPAEPSAAEAPTAATPEPPDVAAEPALAATPDPGAVAAPAADAADAPAGADDAPADA